MFRWIKWMCVLAICLSGSADEVCPIPGLPPCPPLPALPILPFFQQFPSHLHPAPYTTVSLGRGPILVYGIMSSASNLIIKEGVITVGFYNRRRVVDVARKTISHKTTLIYQHRYTFRNLKQEEERVWWILVPSRRPGTILRKDYKDRLVDVPYHADGAAASGGRAISWVNPAGVEPTTLGGHERRSSWHANWYDKSFAPMRAELRRRGLWLSDRDPKEGADEVLRLLQGPLVWIPTKNKNPRRYHTSDCIHLRDGATAMWMLDARQQGYTACPRCKPDEQLKSNLWKVPSYPQNVITAAQEVKTEVTRVDVRNESAHLDDEFHRPAHPTNP